MMEGLDRLAKSSDSVERSRRIAAETGVAKLNYSYCSLLML